MAKGKNLKKIVDGLPDERRRRIIERADQLEKEYLIQQELRGSAGLNQAGISAELDKSHPYSTSES